MARERNRRGSSLRRLDDPTQSNSIPLDIAERLPLGHGVESRYGLCPTGSILDNPNKVRTHSKRQIHKIGRSMEVAGPIAPLIIDENYTLLAGHGRLAAAKEGGAYTVPVVQVFGLTDAKKRVFLLADNRIGEEAGLDRENLARQLPELEILFEAAGFELTDTGFEVAEFDELVVDLGDGSSDIEETLDAALYDEASVLQPGDMLELGSHRLIIGDARDSGVLDLLMRDELAVAAVLDTPYNVRVRDIGGRGRVRHPEFAHASGEMSRPEYVSFLRSSFEVVANRCKPESIVYAFNDWKHVRDMIEAAEGTFDAYLNLVVWNKTNAGQGGLYRNQHELIGVFRVGAAPHQDNVQKGRFGRNRPNVWTYAGVNTFRAGRLEDLAAHPTVKPTRLVADALKDVTKRDAIVLDTFVGSGTTILAAEKTGRRARAVEIEPRYAQVAARRWEKMTGRDAIHVASGLTLNELVRVRQPASKPSSEDQPLQGSAAATPRVRVRTRVPA